MEAAIGALGIVLLAWGVAGLVWLFPPIRRMPIERRTRLLGLAAGCAFVGFVWSLYWMDPGFGDDLGQVGAGSAVGLLAGVLFARRARRWLYRGQKRWLQHKKTRTAAQSEPYELPGWVKRWYDID